jgi:hypothetical protein
MSIRFLEGFDAPATIGQLEEKWGVTNNGAGLSFVSGRTSGHYALRWASGQAATKIYRPLTKPGVGAIADTSQHIFGFAFRFSAYPTTRARIMEIVNSSSVVGGLAIMPHGSLAWVYDAGNFAVLPHHQHLKLNTWHHVEVHLEFSDASSSTLTMKLSVDGLINDYTNQVNTTTIGTDPADSLQMGMSISVGTLDIDDFFMIDPEDGVAPTDMIGDMRIETLIPDGAGATTAWTGSYTDVDIALNTDHDGDTTKCESQTLGQQELFTFGNLAAAAAGVPPAVAVNYIAKKQSAGGASFHAVKRTTGSTVDSNMAQTPQSSYGHSQKIWHTDGDDSAWTVSTVNSSQFGMEVES